MLKIIVSFDIVTPNFLSRLTRQFIAGVDVWETFGEPLIFFYFLAENIGVVTCLPYCTELFPLASSLLFAILKMRIRKPRMRIVTKEILHGIILKSIKLESWRFFFCFYQLNVDPCNEAANLRSFWSESLTFYAAQIALYACHSALNSLFHEKCVILCQNNYWLLSCHLWATLQYR